MTPRPGALILADEKSAKHSPHLRALGNSTWHLALGTWQLALGIWHLARGTWHLALGTWHLEHDNEHVKTHDLV